MGAGSQEHCIFILKQMSGHLHKDCPGNCRDGFPVPCIFSPSARGLAQRSWVGQRFQEAGSQVYFGQEPSLSISTWERGFRDHQRHLLLCPRCFPCLGLFVFRPECLVDVGPAGQSLAVPCSEQGSHRACELPGKNQHFISIPVKQPFDLFRTIKCHFLVEQFPEWLHSCEPRCET